MLSPAVELSAEYWIGLSCISKEVLPVPFQQKYYHFISTKILPFHYHYHFKETIAITCDISTTKCILKEFYVIVQAVFIVQINIGGANNTRLYKNIYFI